MNRNLPRTPFSTALSGSAKETERRLKNIFSGPKKRPPVLFLALVFAACLLCGNLVSCHVAEAEDVPESSQTDASLPEPDASAAADQSAPEAPVPVSPPAVDPAPDARTAYQNVLENMLQNRVLPDGYTFPELNPAYESMSDNSFALADVDGDGREELVILFITSMHAGYRGWVLDCDEATGSVYIQFEGYPSLTFYTNGALAEDDSHAQGSWTSEFWPHTLYCYLPETDRYEPVGHLDAWEKVISDLNEGNLPPFPVEKDTSGAGILYYIAETEEAAHSHMDTVQNRFDQAVDQSVYLAWLEPYLGDAQPLELEYLPLTAENIQKLT